MYSVGVRLYGLAIRLASIWGVPKAKLWVQGRKDLTSRLGSLKEELSERSSKTIWVHCASLGEFEMGLPVMQALKEQYPDHFLLVTFFSPSGYQVRKNHPLPDKVMYLPLDTPSNARRFVDAVRPDLVILVKYEFWINHLREAHRKGARLFLISAVFKKDQRFFKWWGGRFARLLRGFTGVYVQDETSAHLLEGIGVQSVVAGDTRFDRVIQGAGSVEVPQDISRFKGDSPLWVIGSNWQDDDKVLMPAVKDHSGRMQVVMAPHEVDQKRVDWIMGQLKDVEAKRYSQWDGSPFKGVLVIDSIGMLSSIYSLADLSYVGGAFHEALHNVLEPAVFAKPVIFGPQHHKFPEAEELIGEGVARSISDGTGLHQALDWALSNTGDADFEKRSEGLFSRHSGATAKIMEGLNHSLGMPQVQPKVKK